MRKKYFIGIDTETTNGMLDKKGKLDLSQSLVYDIGYQIIDKKGKVYLSRSFVVAEIFLDKELMTSAYFKDKIPMYWEEIKQGKRKLKSFKNIRLQFLTDRKKYNCEIVFAHNAYFDYNALNTTLRYLTGSKYRFFFPYSLEIWDTLKMSRDIFGNKKGYALFCKNNNYLIISFKTVATGLNAILSISPLSQRRANTGSMGNLSTAFILNLAAISSTLLSPNI